MPPVAESTTSASFKTCLPPGAQIFWSLSTLTGWRGGGVPAILNAPLIVAQPVGSATGPAAALVSAAPLANEERTAFTLLTSTRSAGGRCRAQPATSTARAANHTILVPRLRLGTQFLEAPPRARFCEAEPRDRGFPGRA